MSLAFHLAAGAFLFCWLGWWSWLVLPALHILSDAFCLWHPPGQGWPWGLGRAVLDEWRYENLGGISESFVRVPGDFWINYPEDILLKRAMFVLNVVACVILLLAGWPALLAGLWSWLSIDAWWGVRDFWPWLYRCIERVNPHRLADWLEHRIWPGGKPSLPWFAWCEMAAIAALTVLAVRR